MPEFMLVGKPTGSLGKFLPSATGWVFEEKRDGVRAMLVWKDQHVQLVGRSGDITKNYAKLANELEAILANPNMPMRLLDLTLDGEIVCDTEGRDNFAGAISTSSNITKAFVAFDLLFARMQIDDNEVSRDYTSCAHEERRSFLEQLHASLSPSSALFQIAQTISPEDVPRYMRNPDKEGVVAKRATSRYQPGRSKSWLKFKRVESDTFIVGGVVAGQGERSETLGALHLVDPKTLKYAGKVGSGFTQKDLLELRRKWDDFFTGKTTDPVLIEVEFDSRSRSGGLLRFPVYKGLRLDLQENVDKIY